MAYRNDLDALAARHSSLEAEAAQRIAERDDAARLLADARARARLPILDNLRIAAPCQAAWADMSAERSGDARVRHCGDCKKSVFDLSEMTREQAEATIVAHNGKLCVRYFQRPDGTIMTADCAVGTRQRRRRRWVAVGTVAMLAAAAVGWKVRPKATAPDAFRCNMPPVSAHELELGGTSAVTHEERPADQGAVKLMGDIDVNVPSP